MLGKDIKTKLLTAPLDMRVNLHAAAINTGLRSEIGLAVIMFPPMACKEMGHIQYTRDGKTMIITPNCPAVCCTDCSQ